jgi:hypothetical protein
VLSRVCLLFSKISNLQRLRLLGIILTSGIRYRLRSSKVVPSATRTYKARSYLTYDLHKVYKARSYLYYDRHSFDQ